MSKSELSCKSYFLWRAGIDVVEKPRTIRMVKNLSEWFRIVPEVSGSLGLAVVRGIKADPAEARENHHIVHMVFNEGSGVFSDRENSGLGIRHGSAQELLDEYLNELQTHYFLYLKLKNQP